MAESQPTDESAWTRARRDTSAGIRSGWFWFFHTILGIVATTATLLALLMWAPHNIWLFAGIPAAVAIAWLLVGVLFVFVWHLFWAPYRQRDEARDLLLGPELSFNVRQFYGYEVEPDYAWIIHGITVTNKDRERAVSLNVYLTLADEEIEAAHHDVSVEEPPVPIEPRLSLPIDISAQHSRSGSLAFLKRDLDQDTKILMIKGPWLLTLRDLLSPKIYKVNLPPHGQRVIADVAVALNPPSNRMTRLVRRVRNQLSIR